MTEEDLIQRGPTYASPSAIRLRTTLLSFKVCYYMLETLEQGVKYV